MTNTLELYSGDQVTFIDFDSVERICTVTSVNEDVGYGFPGFVCWDEIREGHWWGYMSQVTEINGVATSI